LAPSSEYTLHPEQPVWNQSKLCALSDVNRSCGRFILLAGLKEAIGQGYVYRLRYRYVFLVLIMSETRKQVYESFAAGKEKDLEDVLRLLARTANVFTYIVPAFAVTKPGMSKEMCFFE